MSDQDERLAARVRSLIQVVGAAAVVPADPDLPPAGPVERPAGRGRWLAAAAAVVLVAGAVWVATSRGGDGVPVVNPGTTDTVAATSTTTAQQRIIATWADRVAGQTIAYQMDLSCFCGAAGKWSVVDRDGTVLQAQYLGDGEAGGPVPQLLMTQGLRFAARATGPVLISDTATTLKLSADVDVDSIDDEFGFDITDYRTLPNYPTGAPSGPGTNYQLAGQLVLVGGPSGNDPQPVSGAVRAVNPLDGSIVTYAATNEDRTFSLFVPAGTYRIVGLTPQYETGELECAGGDVAVPNPDATQLVVSCQTE